MNEKKLLKVDVCIVTYKRPALLLKLLISLRNQTGLRDCQYRILVIDNDADESASDVVMQYKLESILEVLYVVEPKQGISFARNKALELAKCDYLCFLDDDEEVKPDWLSIMLGASVKYDADVVFGPVIGVLPDDAPAWAIGHPSFSRPMKETGTVVEHGGSGNVLMRDAVFEGRRFKFDESFAKTGGGDTDFFYRMHSAGSRLVWCNEAVAVEDVPASRLTTEWVYKRSYRGGQCYYRIFVSQYSNAELVYWFIKKIGQVALGGAGMLLLRVGSYSKYVRLRCKVNASLGQITAGLGQRFYYQEYTPDKIGK